MDDLRELFEQMVSGQFEDERRRDFVVIPARDNAMFPYLRHSTVGVIREQIGIHRLGCSHLALGPEQYLGDCDICAKSLCVHLECHARCDRCGVLLCPTCVRKHDDIPYCAGCRTIVCFKKGTASGLRGLHALLSKEL